MHLSPLLSEELVNCGSYSPLGFSPVSTHNPQEIDFQFNHQPTNLMDLNHLQPVDSIKKDFDHLCLRENGDGNTTTTSTVSGYHQTVNTSISPMIISPSISTLNTPRGSIASMQSPMNVVVETSQHQQHSNNTTRQFSAADNRQIENTDIFDTFGYPECNNIATSIYDDNHSQFIANYPSPPRSGYASPVNDDLLVSAPPTYEQHMNMNNYSNVVTSSSSFNNEPTLNSDQYSQNLMQIDVQTLATPKSEPVDYGTTGDSSALLFHAGCSVSFSATPESASTPLLSDNCPETPDSSVKDEVSNGGGSGDPENFICKWNQCNTEFFNMKSFVDHINEQHMESNKKGNDERPCLWAGCSKKFNAKYKLVTHIRVHTGEKPYICGEKGCKRSFARLENRKIHMRSHTGDKPFPCKYAREFNCTKRFSNSSDRAKHEQTHKDPKPYRCEVEGCIKRYTDPSSLRKHVKSHTQEEQKQYRLTRSRANQSKNNSIISSSSTTTPISISNNSGYSLSGWSTHDTDSPSSSGTVSTILHPSFHAGGTIIKMEAESTTNSPAKMHMDHQHHINESSSSPMMYQKTCDMIKMEESSPSPNSTNNGSNPMNAGQIPDNNQVGYSTQSGVLVHQPSSLDDLEGEGLPFDDVPLRFDSNETYEMSHHQEWNSNSHNPDITTMTATTAPTAVQNLRAYHHH